MPGSRSKTDSAFRGMITVARRPIIWAQAAVIVCAYCAYKGSDNYALYAVQVMNYNEQEASQLFTNISWTRPAAALLAGIVADRLGVGRVVFAVFAALAAIYLFWATLTPVNDVYLLMIANMTISIVLVFALRGIYFALLEENQTPRFLTGAAVGLVSLLGFTPDFFFAPIAGRILDANPGLLGHQHFLLFLAAIALLGTLSVVWVLWLQRRGVQHLWPNTTTNEEIRG